MRDEFSNVTIDYQNLSSNQVNKTKKYNGLFPSVYLSYDLDGGNQLLLNYSRRIDRPKGFFMVPYFSLTDDQNIFRGNLDLNPSYINLVELGYSFKSKKLMLNPTVYFSHKTDDDKVITFREDESSNVFYNTPINEGTKTRYGLDLNATLDVSSWLRFMASVDLFGYQTQGNYTYQAKDGKGNIVNRSQSFDGKGFSTRVRLNTTLKFANALTMQIQGGYRGKENSGVKISRAEYDVNLGISKTVLDGNGTIGFNIQDIFNSRSMRRTTISELSTHESFMQFQPRQFSLSFSYRFSQGAGVNLPRNKKGGGDEVKYSEEQQIAL